jgi:hypothetical protein
MRRAGVSLILGILVGLVGASQAAAQCTICSTPSNQPTTSTVSSTTGTNVPAVNSADTSTSVGSYGVGGSSVAPGGLLPTVAGSSIGSGRYAAFLNMGSSDMRLALSGLQPSYITTSAINLTGIGVPGSVWYSSTPTSAVGAPLGVTPVLPSAFTVKEVWHPQSFYGPQLEAVPGQGIVLGDGSAVWPHDPRAPSGR